MIFSINASQGDKLYDSGRIVTSSDSADVILPVAISSTVESSFTNSSVCFARGLGMAWTKQFILVLVKVVKHKAVNESGYSEIFAPLVHRLQKLYSEGFTVTLPDGHTEKFCAVLCTICEDNLSSHALAGFQAVFNSVNCTQPNS